MASLMDSHSSSPDELRSPVVSQKNINYHTRQYLVSGELMQWQQLADIVLQLEEELAFTVCFIAVFST